MPVYISERTIGIKAPEIICDICGVRLNLIGELRNAKIERVERDRASFTMASEGTFIIPGIPVTEEAAALVAIHDRGWSREVIHGKEMLCCPSCKEK
jgi:hypothetical protein